jgi:hypothetical protein
MIDYCCCSHSIDFRVPKSLFAMLADDQFFQANQTKTQIRLLEIEAHLIDVDLKIPEAKQTARELDGVLTMQICFENALDDFQDLQRIQEVRQNIWITELRILSVKKERKRLQTIHASLLRERTALLVPLTAIAFSTFPIPRVPADVLITIFMAAKAEEIEPIGTGVGPLVSRVYGEWRAVACSYHALWTAFSLSAFGPEFRPNYWLRKYLQRSKAAALTIRMVQWMRLILSEAKSLTS